jgi:hypothetical protein
MQQCTINWYLLFQYLCRSCGAGTVPGTLRIERILITGTNKIMKSFYILKNRHGFQIEGRFSGQISSVLNKRIWIYRKSHEIRIHTHEECRVH